MLILIVNLPSADAFSETGREPDLGAGRAGWVGDLGGVGGGRGGWLGGGWEGRWEGTWGGWEVGGWEGGLTASDHYC